jgi:hypothetical protein
VSVPIEAPPESPGHVGHTPQPWVNLGLSLGRLHDRFGGIFGGEVVRALLGRGVPSDPGAPAQTELALQSFALPRRLSDPSAPAQVAAHQHTLLQLEEASYKTRRAGKAIGLPAQLRAALAERRTWQAPS